MALEIEKVINDKELLWKRINNRLELVLKKQIADGKKFITDKEIDDLIDEITKEELG